jgi:hypothetical protein
LQTLKYKAIAPRHARGKVTYIGHYHRRPQAHVVTSESTSSSILREAVGSLDGP